MKLHKHPHYSHGTKSKLPNDPMIERNNKS